MTINAYSIRDGKGEIFHPPFYAHTPGEAERKFHELANDSKSTVSQYPEDFDLYHIGEYDDKFGKFVSLDAPVHLTKAIHLKKVQ